MNTLVLVAEADDRGTRKGSAGALLEPKAMRGAVGAGMPPAAPAAAAEEEEEEDDPGGEKRCDEGVGGRGERGRGERGRGEDGRRGEPGRGDAAANSSSSSSPSLSLSVSVLRLRRLSVLASRDCAREDESTRGVSFFAF